METNKLVANELHTSTQMGVIIRDVKVMDQGSLFFSPLIKKHSSSIFICGYISPVIALKVRQLLEEKKDVQNTVNEVLAYDKSEEFSQALNHSFEHIYKARKAYIENHKEDFSDAISNSDYISAEVAGFEVSSFLEREKASDIPICFLRNVCFDYPELMKGMMHEELEKTKEQEKFKGKKVFLELFLKGKRELVEPKDLSKHIGGAQEAVLLIEFFGHFAAGVYFNSRQDFPNKQIVFLDSTFESDLTQEFHVKPLVNLFLKL